MSALKKSKKCFPIDVAIFHVSMIYSNERDTFETLGEKLEGFPPITRLELTFSVLVLHLN